MERSKGRQGQARKAAPGRWHPGGFAAETEMQRSTLHAPLGPLWAPACCRLVVVAERMARKDPGSTRSFALSALFPCQVVAMLETPFQRLGSTSRTNSDLTVSTKKHRHEHSNPKTTMLAVVSEMVLVILGHSGIYWPAKRRSWTQLRIRQPATDAKNQGCLLSIRLGH